ncbi:MAG: AMP-binding protein, partial [Proteobacteria bacterium]|nr:AMP-binding protein [Pseudomonadota bacterium]MBU1741496.1 AMP-binding protein [Pseudomonadota bacterium]
MERPWLKTYPKWVPGSRDYPEISLAQFLIDTAAEHPDYIATTLNEDDISYAQLNEKVNRFAHALAGLGLGKGDRVAFIVPNSPTYVIAYYAVLKLGAVVVNINVMTLGQELTRMLNDCRAKLAVTLDIFAPNIFAVAAETPVEKVVVHSVYGREKTIELGSDDPELLIYSEIVADQSAAEPGLAARGEDVAVLQYTSGTSGPPKAAVLTHRSISANVLQLESWVQEERDLENEAVICIVPFFHVFGMVACMNLAVYMAWRMILVPMFNVLDALPLMEMVKTYRPVSFPAVPSLWATLVSHPSAKEEPFAAILVPTSGGAPLPAWVREKHHQLTGRHILDAYGLSEASSATHMAPYPVGAPPGSIGLPLPDTDVRIVDLDTGQKDLPVGEVGEMIIRGPQITKEYWNNPELTAQALRDGWLHTGDLARMDEQGFFYLVDRKDDLIISRGFNVYPSEVEKALTAHPKIKEAAVVGRQDRLRGE